MFGYDNSHVGYYYNGTQWKTLTLAQSYQFCLPVLVTYGTEISVFGIDKEQETKINVLTEQIETLNGKTEHLIKYNNINVNNSTQLVNAINSIATSASNNIATKDNQYNIFLSSGTYELYDVIDKTNLQDQKLYKRGLEIPDYVNLIGLGEVHLTLTLPSTETASHVQILSTINTYGENYFKNIVFEITNGRYCCHDDDGGPYKDRTITFEDCIFIHHGNSIGA